MWLLAEESNIADIDYTGRKSSIYAEKGTQKTFWLVNILEKPMKDKFGYKRALINEYKLLNGYNSISVDVIYL